MSVHRPTASRCARATSADAMADRACRRADRHGSPGAFGMFLSWPSVFGADYVAFIENDAWYHMRLVDALVQDFPWRIWHDPYLAASWRRARQRGAGVGLDHRGDGAGARGRRAIASSRRRRRRMHASSDRGADGRAGLRPRLGAVLSNAGLWAAFMVAVMPGQLLERSLLGFTDHHCVETLLSTTVMMFVVLACMAQTPRAATRLGAWRRAWHLARTCSRGAAACCLSPHRALGRAAAAVGCGARRRERRRGRASSIPMLLVAAVMVSPWSRTRPYFAYQFAALVGGAVAIWAWPLGRQVWRRRAWGGRRWMVAAAGVGCVAAAIAWIVDGRQRRQPRRGCPSGVALPAARIGHRGAAVDGLPSVAPHPALEGVHEQPCAGGVWHRPAARQRGDWTSLAADGAARVVDLGDVRRDVRPGEVRLLPGRERRADRRLCVRPTPRGARRRPNASGYPRAGCVRDVLCLVAVPGVPMLRPIRNAGASLDSNWYDALTWLATNTPEPFRNPAEYLPHRSWPFSRSPTTVSSRGGTTATGLPASHVACP